MLKQASLRTLPRAWPQPPLGGCVLKRGFQNFRRLLVIQPPLGGCVLKPRSLRAHGRPAAPAAFRRLCVETFTNTAD